MKSEEVYSDWNHGFIHGLKNVEEDGELRTGGSPLMASVPQPRTPKEPMEFLSRSWSLSASEISKALAHNNKPKHFFLDNTPNLLPPLPQLTGKVVNSTNSRKTGSIGKWFQHKELTSSSVKKKDRARVENAHVHSAMSVAGLAAALAAVSGAGGNSTDGSTSKMSMALASATELLASHCIELAELAGADHDRIASVIRSAVDIRSPGDLMTLTAAAATALRGEAALKARLPKEARKNASISPCERSITEVHWPAAFRNRADQEQNPPCEGELMQHTRKGVLRWKRVSVYINKKSEVIIKLKSKHVGGAFSKNNKCVVYGVCDETTAWPYRKERESTEEMYFGLKTAQGLLEFKCKSKIHKQRWVDGIQSLLRQVTCFDATTDCSLQSLSITNTI